MLQLLLQDSPRQALPSSSRPASTMSFFLRSAGLTKNKVMRDNLEKGKVTFTRVEANAGTALHDVPRFVEKASSMRLGPSGQCGAPPIALEMLDQAMLCNGRASRFDLFWFSSSPDRVFAIDSNDNNYVAVMLFQEKHVLFLSEKNRHDQGPEEDTYTALMMTCPYR